MPFVLLKPMHQFLDVDSPVIEPPFAGGYYIVLFLITYDISNIGKPYQYP